MQEFFALPHDAAPERKGASDRARFWEALRTQDVMVLEEMLSASAEELLRSRDPQTGRGPAQWCCFLRRHDSLRALLAWGADPDESCDGRPIPLSLAVAASDEEAVSVLAQAGAILDQANPDGWRSPLIEAAFLKLPHHSSRMIKALIKAGANPDFVTPKGSFALGASALSNRAADVETLLEAGADIELHAGDGYTALFYAVEHGALDAAAALLKAGADFSARFQSPQGPQTLGDCVGDDSGMAGLLYAFAEAGCLRAKLGSVSRSVASRACARL
jgi:ankyrin repeat protein